MARGCSEDNAPGDAGSPVSLSRWPGDDSDPSEHGFSARPTDRVEASARSSCKQPTFGQTSPSSSLSPASLPLPSSPKQTCLAQVYTRQPPRAPSYASGGDTNGRAAVGRNSASSQRANTGPPSDPATPLVGLYSEGWRQALPQTPRHTRVHSSVTHAGRKEERPKRPSRGPPCGPPA